MTRPKRNSRAVPRAPSPVKAGDSVVFAYGMPGVVEAVLSPSQFRIRRQDGVRGIFNINQFHRASI